MRSENTTTTAQKFGALVTELARRAGYDPTPRTGDRRALVAAIGSMSESAVNRMLDGYTLPQAKYLEDIARAVRTDVWVLLVGAEIISVESVPNTESSRVPSRPITSEEAADLIGFADPGKRQAWVMLTEELRAPPPAPDADADHSRPGGNAAQHG